MKYFSTFLNAVQTHGLPQQSVVTENISTEYSDDLLDTATSGGDESPHLFLQHFTAIWGSLGTLDWKFDFSMLAIK